MFRYLPPAGNRIPINSICNALFFVNKTRALKLFEIKLKKLLRVKYCFLTSSGTSALYLALIALKSLSNKREVILPAYTCPSVLAAIIKAGLIPILCDFDVDKSTFNYADLENNISHKTLAIISVHLFGVLEDCMKINQLIASHNIFHIEDAAQTFVSTNTIGTDSLQSQNIPGTNAAIGIYSFGRGKPFSLMSGGAITTNDNEIAAVLSDTLNVIKKTNTMETVLIVLQSLLYSIFFYPRLYWLLKYVPFLQLGKTIYSLNFKINHMASFTAALGELTIDHTLQANRFHLEKQQLLIHKLSPFYTYFLTNIKNVHLLRFPLLMENKHQRDLIISELNRQGISATHMYPASLNQFEDTMHYFNSNQLDYKNAQSFSERILTIPLHKYVTEKDMDTVKTALERFSTIK